MKTSPSLSEQKRLYSYFSQAPIGFAIVKEPKHHYVLANVRYEKFVGANSFENKAIRDVLTTDDMLPFFAALDTAYATNKGFVENERLMLVDLNGSGKLSEFM